MNNIKIKKIFTFFVVFLPFLYQYKSPISAISFGEFILIPFIIYFLIVKEKTKISYKVFNGIYTYLFCAIFFNLIASFQIYYSYNEFITIFARICYYIILIYIGYRNFDFKYGIKILITASVFFSLYAIIQFITYHTWGKFLPTVISPNLVFSGEEFGNRLDYANYYKWNFRPSSFFLEPGYYISFVAPALLALLHLKKINKKNILFSLIITIGFVISTSSASIVILGLAWGWYIIKNLFDSNKKIKINKIILIFIIILTIIMIFKSPLATTLINRTSTGGSFNNRITRTYMLLKNTNLFQKIVGVGINNVANFVEHTQTYTIYDEKNLNYVSSYLGTLLSSGIFTFVFYNRYFIISFLKNKNAYIRLLIIVFLFYNFIGNIVFTNKFAFYAILIFSAQKCYSEIKE